MSTLSVAAEDYLRLRRSLGYKLTHQGPLLLDFVAFVDAGGESSITVANAVAWASRPVDAAPTWSHARIGVVRGFARYLQALDPETQVPPADLLPDGNHRSVPFIYTDEQITQLLETTQRLQPLLRAATYRTLIGLLAVTGMRIGEAVGLDRGDIDWDQGLLTIEHGKLGKARQLPVQPATLTALSAYVAIRDAAHPQPKDVSFFLSTRGTRLLTSNASAVFARLCRQAGIEERAPRCRPRLHDLRHTFAVATMLGWYHDGSDIGPRLPLLSTYLGHTNPDSTYWYLTGTPELLALAARRLEQDQGARS